MSIEKIADIVKKETNYTPLEESLFDYSLSKELTQIIKDYSKTLTLTIKQYEVIKYYGYFGQIENYSQCLYYVALEYIQYILDLQENEKRKTFPNWKKDYIKEIEKNI